MTAASRRVLVTGAGGFVGSWLLPRLEAAGHRAVGVLKPGLPQPDFGQSWVVCDLRRFEDVASLIREIEPDLVVHLAAVAFPPEAERDPVEAIEVNYVAVDHVARSLVESGTRVRLLHVSTGAVYGARPTDAAPASEDLPPRPDSTYAATKLAAELRLALAHERDGLDVVCARPFNHSGPGRPADYAESSFARQVVRIERGEQEPVLRVGNLDAVRDFSDVRDVVDAYLVLLDSGLPGGTYNVCSGRATPLRSVIDHLVGKSRVALRVERDPALERATAPERVSLVGDPARLRALGWSPRYRVEETLDSLLEAWRGA